MRQVLHKLHLWLGLGLCVPLILLGLSGSILVFQHELEDFFAPAPHATAGTPHSIGEIVDVAEEAAPDDFKPSMYRPPSNADAMAMVFFSQEGRNKGSGPGKRLQIMVDPVSLATVKKDPSGSFMRQLNQFHSSLLLRDYGGRSIVGWFGVTMVLFGLTGLVLWWPRPGQWRHAFKMNKKSRGWKFHRELHGMAGIWGVLALLIVSISGVYLAFPQTMNAFATQYLSARDLRAPPAEKLTPLKDQEALDIDHVIQLAQESAPNHKLASISLPGKSDQPYRVAFSTDDNAEAGPTITVFIDPWQKRIMETRNPQDYSLTETIIAWMHAIHEGQGFGWLWRLLVFMAGLLPLLFSITGISMWLIKRR